MDKDAVAINRRMRLQMEFLILRLFCLRLNVLPIWVPNLSREELQTISLTVLEEYVCSLREAAYSES
jgi:hypothetical protein